MYELQQILRFSSVSNFTLDTDISLQYDGKMVAKKDKAVVKIDVFN